MEDDDHDPAEAAKIVGEIAARISELEGIKRGSGPDLLFKLTQLFRVSPPGFTLVIETLRGNLDATADSYLVQASERGLTKQAVYCELQVALSAMDDVFPQVADAIRALKARALVMHKPHTTCAYAGSLSDTDEHHL
jgi:hypothetical protein